MKNFKWGTTSFNDTPIYVVLFVSRNKDNKDVPDFVERRTSFITHFSADDEHLKKLFFDFVGKGKPGEISRMYYSINERDGQKIYKQLVHFLIDNPEFNLCSIMPKLAGIAATKECAKSKRWMFDFDSEDKKLLEKFIKDIRKVEPVFEIETHKTPHGYAVITERGFDTRSFLDNYKDFVTLKRDDLLCVHWAQALGEED